MGASGADQAARAPRTALDLGARLRNTVEYKLRGAGKAARPGSIGPPVINSRPRTAYMEERQTGVDEGTLVHALQGDLPVRELDPGDQVWSYDRESGRWRLTDVRSLA